MSNLEQAVTSLAQSRKLYELGFTQESNFLWVSYAPDAKYELTSVAHGNGFDNKYPAYLLSEIMEEINKCMLYRDTTVGDRMLERTNKLPGYNYYPNIQETGDLLIWCIENGFISTK